MRSRTSSKHSTKSTGVEEQSKLKDQPHLSGAYVRSLVKQLSSSRTKDPSNPSSGDGKFEDKSPQDLAKPHEIQKEIQQRQPKKQARRRFHTSRPYQERLLNMAEARREIVAALKFHRASMKKASEQKKQLLPRKELLSLPPISQPTEGSQLEDRFKATVNTTGIPINHFSNRCSFPASFPSDLSLYNSTSPVSVTDFKIVFPKPPLGLNLNISDFENLWTTVTCSSIGSPSLHLTPSSSISTPMTTSSTVSSSSSSSQTCSSCTTISVPEVPLFKPAGVSEATSEPRVESFHLTMDDKEMEEIRFIGEQHDMEWNDKLNSVHSAWWSKFLKTMDNDYQPPEDSEGDSFGQVVDEIGIPPWLSDQECLNSYSSNGEWIQDDANLPCLDFGEIEGLYGEWLLYEPSR